MRASQTQPAQRTVAAGDPIDDPETASESADRRPWAVLIVLSVAQFMVVLDVTVVNVALPSIGRALDFAPTDLQWVITAYVLFTGGLLLLGGRATDLLGRRRVFLAGLTLFTAASLASGLAPSSAALVVARAAQGLGAAMLTPGALSIIVSTYTGQQRAVALSAWGAIGSAGAAAGVVLGGMLTTWLGWESIFFVNVPVGIATGVLALRLVPAHAPAIAARRELDLGGAVALVAGLMVLVYAIEGTGQHGWGSARTLVLGALAAGLLATFVAIERRARHPLVPPAVWKVRSLVSGVGLMFGATGVVVGTFFLNSLYLQRVLGASALETGLAFLPLALVIGLGAHLASHLLRRAGTRALAATGTVLTAAGSLLLAAAPDHASYVTDMLPGFLAVGLGAGLVFPAASVTTMNDVGDERSGLASGLMSTGHEVGAALGVATFSAVATAASTFVAGYADGFLAAAVLAGVLAIAVLVVLPAVRPSGEARLAVH
jgi:EmrB/QacA subfamily drug resistance transporter